MSTIRQGSPGFRRPGSVSLVTTNGAGHQLIYTGTVLDINGQPIPLAQCQLSVDAVGSGPIAAVVENLGVKLTEETAVDSSQLNFQTDIKGEFNLVITYTAAAPTARHFVRAFGGEGDAGALSVDPIP